MKLNHLNLPVENVAETRRFFEQYLGFETIETKGDNMLSVLHDDTGFSLVIMANNFNRNGNSTYPDVQHIGFLVATKEEVNSLYEKLKAGGIELQQTLIYAVLQLGISGLSNLIEMTRDLFRK